MAIKLLLLQRIFKRSHNKYEILKNEVWPKKQTVKSENFSSKRSTKAKKSQVEVVFPTQHERIKLTDDQRLQLEEQMRMFVQLLTQSYLLSFGNPALEYINYSSNRILKDLKEIASCGNSSFQAYNLDEALAIVKKFESRQAEFPVLDTPYYEIKKTICNSKVFMYPDLLPRSGFISKASKLSFCPAEDNLIALGLERFSSSKTPEKDIQEALIPCKPVSQIKLRIQYSELLGTSDNPIKYYFQHKKAPECPRVVKKFSVDEVKVPRDQPLTLLPSWAWKFSYHKLTENREGLVKQECFEDATEIQKYRQLLPQDGLKFYQKSQEGTSTTMQYGVILPPGSVLIPFQFVETNSVQICPTENQESNPGKALNLVSSLVLPNHVVDCDTVNQLAVNSQHVLSEEINYNNTLNSNTSLNKITILDAVQTEPCTNHKIDSQGVSNKINLESNDIKVSELKPALNSEICNVVIKNEIIDSSDEQTEETCLNSKICDIAVKKEIIDYGTVCTQDTSSAVSMLKNGMKRVSSDAFNSFSESDVLQMARCKNFKRRKIKTDSSDKINDTSVSYVKEDRGTKNLEFVSDLTNCCNVFVRLERIDVAKELSPDVVNNKTIWTRKSIKSNALQAAKYKKRKKRKRGR